MSHSEDCSEIAWRQSVARVQDFLNHVVQEIRWSDRLNRFNHCPPAGAWRKVVGGGGGFPPPPLLVDPNLGGWRVRRSAAGLPGRGRWVPQHTYLKIIPMTR